MGWDRLPVASGALWGELPLLATSGFLFSTAGALVVLRVTAGLRGRTLWFTALHLVPRAPLVPLGVLALVFVALLLAPGPVALFASTGTWTEKHALHR
ncbi:hypothetical protein [Kribbella sindirgiensis]|uniref:hypothetical protein n=1 Tax=Kribbella sindirgiensis TaxID=1124744 RepID=UPI0013F48B4D|nr:hypothetical protein [Kribbella sindirgiensis]